MPRPCSTRSGTPIWWRAAPTAATSSTSTATCCMSCTRPHAFEKLEKAQRPVRRPDLTFSMQDHTVADQARPRRHHQSRSGAAVPARDARGQPPQRHPAVRPRRSRAGHLARGRARTRHGAAGRDPCRARQPCLHGRRPRRARLRLRHHRARAHPRDAGDGAEAAEAHARPRSTAGSAPHVTAKDVALRIIAEIGVAGGRGHAVEYAGAAVRAMPIESRLTLCNLTIEMGARSGFVAPDDATFPWIAGRPFAPQGALWDSALAHWRTLASDDDAEFDREIVLDCSDARAADHLGHRSEPGDRHPRPRARSGRGRRRQAARRCERALDYMGLDAGHGARGPAGRPRVHRLLHQQPPARSRSRRRGGARPQGRGRRRRAWWCRARRT